ncbi:response regulator transcription factor [Rhodopseudomonas palustris]|uniref:response regulator transcription factor n=1 Tax=Rhodopseudomonas palustris TaxID=1076 RepID=UPI0002F214C4|nr:response regulator [Rhodopseudomonas palustris]
MDDDEDVRESISSFFRSVGLHVEGFAAAETFLASPSLPDTDCLITDLHMPGMDGLGLHRELLRRGVNIPVIMMTAYSTPEARAEASDLGAAGFVDKPVDPEILLHDVEAILRAARHRRVPSDRSGPKS